jgi:hypothetical protein
MSYGDPMHRQLGGNPMHQRELQRLTNSYHKIGSPKKAEEAINWIIDTQYYKNFFQPDGIDLPAYFFGRLTLIESDLLRVYESLFQNSSSSAKIWILSILSISGDEQTKKFLERCLIDNSYKPIFESISNAIHHLEDLEPLDFLSREIKSGADLDLLWVEYSITGNEEPINRIITVLDWPDIVREKMESWLRSVYAQTKDNGHLNFEEEFKSEYGFRLDLSLHKILNLEDIDCLIGMNDLVTSAEKFEAFQEICPIDITFSEKNYIATKMSAKWSLGDFSREDETVRNICYHASRAGSNERRFALLEIIAHSHAFQMEYEESSDALMNCLELDPECLRIKEKLKYYHDIQEKEVEVRQKIEGQLFSIRSSGVEARKVCVLDVPFLRIEEAAEWDYPDKGVLNPSHPASEAMITTYWGEEYPSAKNIYDDLDGWKSETGAARSLKDLKPYIREGIPILLSLTALTPYAHPITYQIPEMMGHNIPNNGPFSGALGRMLPLIDFERMNKDSDWSLPGVTLGEMVFLASRVVIGYNDDESRVILHDPIFGPMWKLSYDDFDRMWAAGNRMFSVAYPLDYLDKVRNMSDDEVGPTREPDDDAAVEYVFSYGLSSTGRAAEAESNLRRGVDAPGMSEGMRFLYNYELAAHLYLTGKNSEAIRFAEISAEIIPYHYAPWGLLEKLYSRLCEPPTNTGAAIGCFFRSFNSTKPEGKLRKARTLARKLGSGEDREDKARRALPRRFRYDDFLYGLSN